MLFWAGVLFCVLVAPFSALAGEVNPHSHHHSEGSGASPAPEDSAGIVFSASPSSPAAGKETELRFAFSDRSGNPLRNLAVTHERLIHVVIVSRDFRVFAHIHPEDFGPITQEMKSSGIYRVRYTFPSAGTYLIAVDSASDGMPLSNHFLLEVAGSPKLGDFRPDFSRTKAFNGLRATLTTDPARLAAGALSKLSFVIEENGVPVRDLEPYLAAPMHLAVIRADLKSFQHAHGGPPGAEAGHHHPAAHIHGQESGAFGPEIDAEVIFPAKGIYELFGQIKRRGEVILLNFAVEVQ